MLESIHLIVWISVLKFRKWALGTDIALGDCFIINKFYSIVV